ncbi:MAG: hypothetical protein ACTSRP_18115 [Candidatus Helarchaeota archaeon]
MPKIASYSSVSPSPSLSYVVASWKCLVKLSTVSSWTVTAQS